MHYWQRKKKPFVNLSNNRYTPLEAVSSDTKGPISQEDIDGNKYSQLLAYAGTGHLSGVAMKTKGGASDAIIKALTRLQVLCGRAAKRLHTDGAKEEDTANIKQLLLDQGTTQTHTAPGSSQSNVIVDRRFESVFANVRASILVAPPPLNSKGYWSIAALDSIDKTNYLPFKRDDLIQPSPYTAMQLHGCDADILGGPNLFLPYGQAGFIVNTAKFKKKLEDRAVPANYLRCLSKDTYQVFRRGKMNITTIRESEFAIKIEKQAKRAR